jgi:hypothetical protein
MRHAILLVLLVAAGWGGAPDLVLPSVAVAQETPPPPQPAPPQPRRCHEPPVTS